MLRNIPTPEDYGIFSGFTIKYPEYTVITPQTGLTFTTRSLNVSEVSKLRGSLAAPSKIYSIINEIIWDAITTKPDFIDSYDIFKKSITLKDREALLYGVHVMTFGYEREVKIPCQLCTIENNIKFNMKNTFSITPYPKSESMKNMYKLDREVYGVRDEEMEKIIENNTIQILDEENNNIENQKKEQEKETPEIEIGTSRKLSYNDFYKNSILSEEVPVTLPISKVKCILFQPTIEDELKLAEIIPYANKKHLELLSETLIIKRLEYYSESHKTVVNITDKMEIFSQYQKLPYQEKILITNKFKENFSDYGIDLKLKWVCTECNAENETPIDLTLQFFRVVASGQ